MLPEQPDEEQFRATARQLDIDEDAYIRALRKVSVRSSEQTEASLNLLASVINQFVQTSYAAQMDAETLIERARIISSLGRIYSCDYYIDLDADRFAELDATRVMHAFAGSDGIASQAVYAAIRRFVQKDYQADYQKFADLSTMKERLAHRNSISFEAPVTDVGWCRAIFIVVDRDITGLPSHVIYAIQQIQEEKERELKVRRALEKAADEAREANDAKSDFLAHESRHSHAPERHHRHDVPY